ncbi:septum formation inhibitor Maf [Alcaligenaceae bacterium]|nr:septum formation inhibitor Maf [Alcaligenaceae bacterium]
MTTPILYLASASPRRHEILQQLGIAHQILHVPAPDGEDEPQLVHETAAEYVQRTALEKAIRATQWLAQTPMDAAKPAAHCNDLVLAADTTVILAGQVLGKPLDPAHAVQILKQLSGQTHYVHTAVVLAYQGRLLERVSITEVKFSVLSDDTIGAYCNSNEPMGKAGAYGIQGRAAAFIESISGSYTGVMGLPAFETCQLLEAVSG